MHCISFQFPSFYIHPSIHISSFHRREGPSHILIVILFILSPGINRDAVKSLTSYVRQAWVESKASRVLEECGANSGEFLLRTEVSM
jgi:hypothetical protein